MPVLKNIAAIAKGMSITFREMFEPTVVENYPDGPGPLKGAMFQERYRGVHENKGDPVDDDIARDRGANPEQGLHPFISGHVDQGGIGQRHPGAAT